MTAADPVLLEMVRKLAMMAPSERTFVLDQLGERGAGFLKPCLAALEERPLSSALSGIVAEHAANGRAKGLTPRAIAAVQIAVSASSPADFATVEPVRERPARLWERAAALLARS